MRWWSVEVWIHHLASIPSANRRSVDDRRRNFAAVSEDPTSFLFHTRESLGQEPHKKLRWNWMGAQGMFEGGAFKSCEMGL